MRILNRFGLTSLLVGAASLPVAEFAVRTRSTHIFGFGYVLGALEKLGLVKHYPYSISSISEQSLFAINDENAIVFLFVSAVLLAVIAMALAVAAEYFREKTLYLSSGYVCGALAIAMVKPIAGLVLAILGAMAILVFRHSRNSNDT